VGKSVSVKGLAATTLLLMPLVAHAAGLGRITVLSQLGQPLNAEIELVSLQPGEEESLAARIASQDSFAQAGIEFNPALSGIRLELQRRQGRNPVLRLSSSQPLNEPFIEMLVEVQWATGRLVREYSFLLDPPEYKGPRPITATPARPAAPEVAKPAPIKPAPAAESKPIPPAPSAPAPTPSPTAASAAGSYEVKPGDTLGKIAAQNARPGVSLQQMLAALYQANQDAFINGNINLLRSGRILTIPDQQTAAGIDPNEANQLVRRQAAGFAEYQQKAAGQVAAAPAAAAPGPRTATGAIAPKPEAKPPAEPKDQLKLSKADAKKPSAAESKAARGDDAVARERALKDAQARVSDLEKNVADLQKLLELKNQQLAQLEKAAKPGAVPAKPEPPKAAVKEPAKAEPPKPEPAKTDVAKADAKKEPAKPEPPKAEPPKPEPAKPEPPKVAAKAEPPKPEPPKAEVAKPEPPKPEPGKAEPAKPEPPKAEPPKTDVAKATDAKKEPPKADPGKPKAKPPAAPPAPEPGIVDQFLDNPLALGGLAGVLALLGGYGVFAWRKKKAAQSRFQDSVLGAASTPGDAGSVLSAGSAAAAAPSVSEASVSSGGMAPAEADDVDPIAEADVYMAYGRDAQAEEILKEALAKDPNRTPVMGKLLEIYANRRDAKAFEALALKLKGATGGEGAEWEKAAALGRSIDSGNSVYGGGAAADVPAPAAAAAAAPTLDFDIGGGGGGAEPPASTDISLDLGGSDQEAAPSALDFDLGGGTTPGTPTASADTQVLDTTQAAADSGGLDFDLGGDTSPATPAVTEAPAPAAAAGGMDFDLDLDMGGGEQKAAAPAGDVDLSAISLDLGGTPSADSTGGGGEKWQEVATKLDLAKAYEEMGDKDGAKDLLNEVMSEGDAAQQAQAKQMLAALG
jgi:pilus assembly protein FimV